MIRRLFGASALALGILVLMPSFAQAATLYIDPPSGSYAQGSTMLLKVRLDNGEECVNAAEVKIGYPKSLLRPVDVSIGGSIFTLFTEPPTIDKGEGTIIFSGGIPGGYCGRVPGDPGLTNVLVELVFQAIGAPSEGSVRFLPGTEVLVADGAGTPAELSTKAASFTITPGDGDAADPWLDAVRADDIPPQAFAVELSRDGSLYNGAWFIAFSTTDKESGIDHYEVMETDTKREGFRAGSDLPAVWQKASSPYRLTDQALRSTIRVKAVDKAGNERLAGLIPDALPQSSPRFRNAVLTALVLLGSVAGVSIFLWRRSRAKARSAPAAVPLAEPTPPSDIVQSDKEQ